MIKCEKVTKETDEVTDIICNKCGVTCKDEHEMNYEGLIGAYVIAGYGAEYLYDGVGYSFDLCEKCIFELFKTFKHPPSLSSCGGMIMENMDFKLAKEQLYGKNEK